MIRRSLFLMTAALLLAARVANAGPMPAQTCESAMAKASGTYASCRLAAESAFSKSGDTTKRTAALGKCQAKLQGGFAKAQKKANGACPAVATEAEFDTYLTQCSDDTAAAAGGEALPDYLATIATCNASLTTCQGDLATCQATPPAQLLKTGQTTGYGAGSDGDLQRGVALDHVDNGDGTITDTKTGLMWEKKSADGDPLHDKGKTYSWTSTGTAADGTVFTTFLAGLNAGSGFAGYTDWRLPNLTELESIRNLENVNPAVSAAFNNNCNAGCTVATCSCISAFPFYWSSSTYASDANSAWFVYFYAGAVSPDVKTIAWFARAVRGGS
jgi:uncharacterized protein DUF1566